MKKSELAMVILIASVSVMVAFFVANSLPFLKVDEQGVEVPTIESISAEVDEPDTAVFNKRAINPTVQTVVGGNSSDDN